MLMRREALERAGGFARIADRVIDDVSLARVLKPHGQIRLAVSRSDVESLRSHDFGGIWRMVRRTAFTQLRHSPALLALTVALLLLLFAVPPALTIIAALRGDWLAFALAAVAWALTFPLAACLYGAMSVDSAFRRRKNTW